VTQIINQQEIEVLDAVVDAQQKERKGIAKEIHDTLGSFLATLKYQHEAGKDLSNQDPSNQVQHELMEKLISQTATEIRSIAHQMATGEKFDFNLQAAISQLVDRIRNTQQFDLQFNYWGKEFSQNRELDLTIYRVTQELLSNVLKHAQASEAILQINQNEEEITLMVEDNGLGFVSDSEPSKGLGLRSIRERIQKINGQVNIDSHPQKGTTIILTIPIH
jgi:signal transduction histidine kinase